MDTPELLTHFNRLADAPGAIPRLRRLVLDLAVRGKLVAQDPGDLLDEDSRETQPSEGPFDIPPNWTWKELGSICSKTGSGSTPRGGKEVYRDHGIPFLRSQNIHNDGISLEDVAYIDGETHLRMIGTKVVPGDLLLNITGGSIGRCAIVPDDFPESNVSQHVAIIRPKAQEFAFYLHKAIMSPHFQSFVNQEQTGAGRGGLPKNRMDKIPIPIPPLAEQHRIVAKVDELMGLLDQIEARQTAREATRRQLTTASLARLSTSDTSPDDFRDHARFLLDHIPAHTTRRDQIKQLRQTILNLAVRGKLVEQNSNETSAVQELSEIKLKKKRILEDGKFKSLDGTLDRPPVEQAFPAPQGWIWCNLDDIAAIGRGGSPRPIQAFLTDDDNGIPWIKIGDSTRGSIYIDSTEERIKASGLSKSRLVVSGDLLLSNSMSFGFPYITRIQGCIHDGWLVIRTPQDLVSKLYLHKLFLSDHASAAFSKAAAGAVVQNLNADKVRQLAVPLPPLAEQHRIVAKVNELMTLCDHLDAALDRAESHRTRLLDALLHEALSTDSPTAEAA